jgi:hypothetical protein
MGNDDKNKKKEVHDRCCLPVSVVGTQRDKEHEGKKLNNINGKKKGIIIMQN